MLMLKKNISFIHFKEENFDDCSSVRISVVLSNTTRIRVTKNSTAV